MMNFEDYLLEQLHIHPSMQPQDIVKLCYQAAFGGEHLLKDKDKARVYLEEEYQTAQPQDMKLYERISQDVCRIHLSAWKRRGYPIDWLFQMFVSSFITKENSQEVFLEYLNISEKLIKYTHFSIQEWQEYMKKYKKLGMPAIHHSLQYQQQEQPSYRIVDAKYIRLLPILDEIMKQNNQMCIIAIDGRAASGKSTIAKQLQNILEADIIHMDDFFLPMHLRSEERLYEAGGNIHYERFQEEVLPFLRQSKSFSYYIFDCSQMNYHGKRTIKSKHIRIVEGSYSCHPIFSNYANITVFSTIDSQEQMKRIIHRNGNKMAKIFQDKWIPLEEKYFEYYSIEHNVDICV